MAASSALASCSGRLMRSQKRETGLKQSLTETSYEVGSSSSWSTGLAARVAKMSPGSRSTGSRLTVASAAPVTMFVAPGPIDDVQASVDSRFFIRAYATAACTIPCSLRAWWYGTPSSCSSAWPTPATLPWPKIPKQPAIRRCSVPSRSLYWLARKRMSACATVNLMHVPFPSSATADRAPGRPSCHGSRRAPGRR